jgi:ABC-type Fe3+/spermidine/putrescine transport system ATPase subunit
MTVAGNVGFGLKMRGTAKAELAARVGTILRLTRIEELAARYPSQLSGGQQQRVALARALVTEPDILLLDEPFGALDQSLREQMQIELRKLQQSLGTTTIVVTHDQLEALTLSDLIAVMNEGFIEQLGPPDEVFDRPATTFVAKFMGVENILPCEILDRSGPHARIVVGDLEATVPTTASAQISDKASLAVRAEAIRLTATTESGSIGARIVFASNRGASALYELETDSGMILHSAEQRDGRTLRQIGSRVGVALVGDACSIVRG